MPVRTGSRRGKSSVAKVNLRADGAQVLFQVLEQGQSLRECLPPIQERHKDQDKAWLQEMVYGCLRQLPVLQFWLRQLLDKPLKKRTKVVEHLIMLGLYQLAFSRVSVHAAVSETVAACPSLKATSMKGLVNGILRNFIRQDLMSSPPRDAQLQSGLPKWLYKALDQAYPEQLPDLICSMQDKAPVWLRVNRQQVSLQDFCQALTDKGISFEPSDAHSDGLRLTTNCDITGLPGFDQGWFAVQDGAAQLAVEYLQPQADEVILDACAAPGGKTCHILERQPGITRCDALDVEQSRLQRVSENLLRLKLDATIICGDASQPAQWWDGQQYDRILLDAPCSATGVIRRHPDIKWLRKATDIQQLVTLQANILDAMWTLLKPGGTLLYATCSILPQENSQQISQFLQRTSDATLSPLSDNEQTEYPGRQILPGENKMDGFYYARLIKSL